MDKTITQPIIQTAINLAGGTQASLAGKAKISQNAVWKLLTGKTKRPSYRTAVALETAVCGQISRYEFMEMEQGESTQESQHARTDAAGHTITPATETGTTFPATGRERTKTHVCDSQAVGG